LIQDIIDNPVAPTHWGKNQRGMQAGEELSDEDRAEAIMVWNLARTDALRHARWLANLGTHKQIANRILEPFAHINVIVTATEWDNFFDLRDHPAAQPEIAELARVMRKALDESEPRVLGEGDWHLPYLTQDELAGALSLYDQPRVSAARCARVSYMTHDGAKPDAGKDLALFEQLASERHMSPMEHQATPCDDWCRNFKGWRSFRAVMEIN
jgi:thymidylate synthase ThyX